MDIIGRSDSLITSVSLRVKLCYIGVPMNGCCMHTSQIFVFNLDVKSFSELSNPCSH